MLFKKALWISLGLLLLAGHARSEETEDDDPVFAACADQQAALEACATTNDCLACEDKLPAEPEPPAIFSEEGPPAEGEGEMPAMPDFSAIQEQFNSFISANCDYFKESVCNLKACCPPCAAEIEASYSCLGAGMSSQMDASMAEFQAMMGGLVANVTDMLGGVMDELGDAAGNLTGALGEVGDALGGLVEGLAGGDEGGEPGAPAPEMGATCDLENIQCPAPGAEGGASDAPAASDGATDAPASGSHSSGLMAASVLATMLILQNL